MFFIILKKLSFADYYHHLMSNSLRFWLFAVTILLLAEDFQYILKIGDSALDQTKSEILAGCEESEEGEEGNKEKEEKQEEKEEKKEKDDENKLSPDDFSYAGTLLAKNKFSDALDPLSAIAHDLESPPPEI